MAFAIASNNIAGNLTAYSFDSSASANKVVAELYIDYSTTVTPPGTQTVNYINETSDFKNPERGITYNLASYSSNYPVLLFLL